MKKCFLLLGTLLLLLALTACGSAQTPDTGSNSAQPDVPSSAASLPETAKSDGSQPAAGPQQSSASVQSDDGSQPADASQPDGSAGQPAANPVSEPSEPDPVVVTKPVEKPQTTQDKPRDPPAQSQEPADPVTPEPGGETDPDPEPADPEPPKATKEAASAYIGRSVSSLIAAIGTPNGQDYAPSCLGDGEDGELFYDGFTVYTYRINGQETVQDVI